MSNVFPGPGWPQPDEEVEDGAQQPPPQRPLTPKPPAQASRAPPPVEKAAQRAPVAAPASYTKAEQRRRDAVLEEALGKALGRFRADAEARLVKLDVEHQVKISVLEGRIETLEKLLTAVVGARAKR